MKKIRFLGASVVVLALASPAAATQIVLPPRTTAKATMVVDETARVLMGAKAARVKTSSPSEMVTVTATESSPTCPSYGGRKFDIQQEIDGATGLFAIPSGKVFVITSFEWWEAGATPSLANVAQLAVLSPGGTTTPFVSTAILDAAGTGGNQLAIPNGFPVRGVSVICLVSTNPGFFDRGFLHGYLADDE